MFLNRGRPNEKEDNGIRKITEKTKWRPGKTWKTKQKNLEKVDRKTWKRLKYQRQIENIEEMGESEG